MQIEDKNSNIKPIPGRRIVVSYIVNANILLACHGFFIIIKDILHGVNLAQSAINLKDPTKCSSSLTFLS